MSIESFFRVIVVKYVLSFYKKGYYFEEFILVTLANFLKNGGRGAGMGFVFRPTLVPKEKGALADAGPKKFQFCSSP